MVIAHNISAINTYKSMGIATTATNKSMEKLSSGYRINRAGDDAAGLSISEKMRSQIRGLTQASRNAQDGVSMIQTAEGALNETHSILQRMRELAVQSATDTNADTDREALQNEISQLTSEINRIGNTTEFNGMKLLDGSKSSTTVVSEGVQTKVAKGGTAEFTTAQGVTQTNGPIHLVGKGVTLSSGSDGVDFSKLQSVANTNKITITENANNDGFTVDISLVEYKDATHMNEASLKTITVDSEAMIKNADGSFTYDNHGVKFSISASEAASIFDNGTADSVKIDLLGATGTTAGATNPLNAASQSFGVNNEYTTDGVIAKVSDFKLASYGDGKNLDYGSVDITYTSGASASDAATLTVKYYASTDCSGAELITDTITLPSVGTAQEDVFTYNANGLSFNIDKAKDGWSDSMRLKVNLEDKLGTENAAIGATYEDNSAYFHVGANENQAINMSFGDMRAAALGLVATTTGSEGFAETANVSSGLTNDMNEYSLDISTRAGSNAAIGIIDNAIQKVSEERSKYGAVQNRIEYTMNNLNTTSENLQSAESRIRDVDMANEMMEMTKNNILQQASQAMLSQALQRPQQALQLLQG